MTWKNIAWQCDPIGSFLFIVSATLMLLALDWAGGVYPWYVLETIFSSSLRYLEARPFSDIFCPFT